MRQADCQCDRVLQLRDPVATADPVRRNGQRGGAGAHHVDITGGHYTFCGGQPIDLDALIAELDLR